MLPPLRARHKHKPLLVIAGSIFMVILLGGWKAPDRAARKKNPIPTSEQSLKMGKQFYARECQDCHGATGKGNGPAAKDMDDIPDLALPRIQKQTDGELFYKITTGRKPMPAAEKSLTEEQRWHVVNYIRGMAKGDLANR
jgi:mono/diheme cytochrome c family protein